MKIKLISAVAIDGSIGKDNKLLWYIPEDLARYKEFTVGKYCVVGVNTYNSLPDVAKKNRIYCVVDGSDDIKQHGDNIIGFKSPQMAIKYIEMAGAQECFIVGGAMLYKSMIKHVDECYITWVNKTFDDADAFFPMGDLFGIFESTDESRWELSRTDIMYKYTKYTK